MKPSLISELERMLTGSQRTLNDVCRQIAEQTKDQFGVLIMGSATLDESNSPLLAGLVGAMVQDLSQEQVVDTWITGGGSGLMAVCNRAAKQAGVNSWGVQVSLAGQKSLVDQNFFTHCFDAEMFEARLLVMAAVADVVVFLPGGYGTWFELLWWLQRVQLCRLKFSVPYPIIPRSCLGLDLRPRLIADASFFQHTRRQIEHMANYRPPTIGKDLCTEPRDCDLVDWYESMAEAKWVIKEHRQRWNAARERQRARNRENAEGDPECRDSPVPGALLPEWLIPGLDWRQPRPHE